MQQHQYIPVWDFIQTFPQPVPAARLIDPDLKHSGRDVSNGG
jgi:hypothetical protein